MNLLDKAINLISPKSGFTRLKYREALNAYEATKTTKTRKPKESKDDLYHLEMSAVPLRNQARYQYENYDFVVSVLDTLVVNIIGPNGIGIEPMPLTYSGEIHKEFAKTISQRFSNWSVRPEVTAELTRSQAERLACMTWLRDGEVFGRKLIGNIPDIIHATDTPFSLQLLEPDYVPYDYLVAKNNIYHGIQRNGWGRAEYYYFHKQNPGEIFFIKENALKVPADQVIHQKYIKRLGQGRGISILAPVLTRLHDIKDYEESERVAARIAAALTWYIKSEDNKGDKGHKDCYLSPGKRLALSDSDEVGTIQSNRPSALLSDFLLTMRRMVAAGTRVNFSSAAKQYDGNYGAQRQELVESYLGYAVLQDDFIAGYSRPVYRTFVAADILGDGLKIPREVDPSTLFNAVYQGPVMPWIDPDKEGRGWERLVRLGGSTLAEIARQRGKNYLELRAQRKREINDDRDDDLVFTSDAYHEYYGTRESTHDKKSNNQPDDN